MNKILRLLTFDKHYRNIIRKRIKNVFLDLALTKGSLGGSIDPVVDGGTYTQSTDYDVLEYIFQRVPVSPCDVLVDVGCGKGRVIFWWLYKGFKNKLIGVEVNEIVAKEANEKLKKHRNVEIISGSIENHVPTDATIFYLFNPFNATHMESLKNTILTSIKHTVTIVYYNCYYVNTFQDDSRCQVKLYDIDLPGYQNKQFAIITINQATH